MPTFYTATKDLRVIVEATFPKYRKHKVGICPTSQVTFYDCNWSGGTKSDYRACSIDGKQVSYGPEMGAAPPWSNPYEGRTVDLPSGFCLVRGGFFCGKESTLTIYVNPADMPKLLPVPVMDGGVK